MSLRLGYTVSSGHPVLYRMRPSLKQKETKATMSNGSTLAASLYWAPRPLARAVDH